MHPRAESLRVRERLVEALEAGILTESGLIAHGRGECFDYLIGEKTRPFALRAEKAAVATLLLAEQPVISVNGNSAALCAPELIELSHILDAKLEVNLFYRSKSREKAIGKLFRKLGFKGLLGNNAKAKIPGLKGGRAKVDPTGLLIADTVMVAIEDGDRTLSLVRLGKKVIAIELNPLSRTASAASITIVDNILRATPRMIELAKDLRYRTSWELREITKSYNNSENLMEAVGFIGTRLTSLSYNEVGTLKTMERTIKLFRA
jgi:4-phosphopantoate--beta-alanine ligase